MPPLSQLKRITRLSMFLFSAPGLCMLFFGWVVRGSDELNGEGNVLFILGALTLGVPLVLVIIVQIMKSKKAVTLLPDEEEVPPSKTVDSVAVPQPQYPSLQTIKRSRNWISGLLLLVGLAALFFPVLVFRFEWMIPTLLMIMVSIIGMGVIFFALVMWVFMSFAERRARNK